MQNNTNIKAVLVINNTIWTLSMLKLVKKIFLNISHFSNAYPDFIINTIILLIESNLSYEVILSYIHI